MNDDTAYITRENLHSFCVRLFCKLGLSDHDASISADVLVRADLRGIKSHGVSRIKRYTDGIVSGLMKPDTKPELIRDRGAAFVMSANGAMGQPAAYTAMSLAISRAAEYGMSCGCLRDSNHFGIASFYSMMALDHDMIGFCLTNTAALSVPSGGRRAMVGTNPISFAAPAGNEAPFVLDLSTSISTRGHMEILRRQGKPVPPGLAVDKEGQPATDPASLLDDMYHQRGGGMLTVGGHKGYGLAMMVDICCAVLAGAPFGADLSDLTADVNRVSHFFAAVKIDVFRDTAAFKADMDIMLRSILDSEPAKGVERVLYPGLLEYEREQKYLHEGIPLLRKTADQLCELSEEFGVPCIWKS